MLRSFSLRFEYFGEQDFALVCVACEAGLGDLLDKPRKDFRRLVVYRAVHSCAGRAVFHVPPQQWGVKQQLFLPPTNRPAFFRRLWSAGAAAVVFHVLRYRFIWDVFREEKRRHSFKLHRQNFWDFDVYLSKTEPLAVQEPFFETGQVFWGVVYDLFVAARQIMQHRRQLQRVGVVTDDPPTGFRAFETVRADHCLAGCVVAFEHQAFSAHHRLSQHLIGFFAGAEQLGASLDHATQKIVHAHAWEAYRVFQNVDALFCAKRPHLLQGF